VITDVVIPAFNEEGNIARVVEEIPRGLVRQIIVSDNGSTDRTAENAAGAGAIVIHQPERGYGAACLAAIERSMATTPPPDVIAFIDGDLSDFPEELGRLLAPIERDEADMVLGSRALGRREPGSMTPQQVFGNWLATRLMCLTIGHRYTDLGPFRVIRASSLEALGMKDRNYGWTVEMQIKAVKNGLRIHEIPVDYRRRSTGKSKVAGTLKGTIGAGYKIILTILRYW
jgi:glycosyltransferase involved in cell wall biosynthesis